MSKGEEERDVRRVDCLGFMLAECSFAYLGWLNAKSDSKVLWSG
jgi:hypothetical protein